MTAAPPPDVRQHHDERLSPLPVPQAVTQSAHSPRTPSTASLDSPLLPDAGRRRSQSVSPPFVSSPLNPYSSSSPPFAGSGRQSIVFNRMASEESQALTHRPSLSQNRASMILYRLAEEYEQRTIAPYFMNRHSVRSNSGDSTFTLSYDSKYPAGAHASNKLVAYPFDPSLHIETPEDDDALHDPSDNTPADASTGIALRGFVNIGVLILVILALLCLFIFYPIWHYVVKGNGTVP